MGEQHECEECGAVLYRDPQGVLWCPVCDNFSDEFG